MFDRVRSTCFTTTAGSEDVSGLAVGVRVRITVTGGRPRVTGVRRVGYVTQLCCTV